jgi:predicted AAA+ superfamily ATPase
MICLDEIQRTPDIFPILRGVIDRNRRNGQFLILGSASRDLIRQSSESLPGRFSLRICYRKYIVTQLPRWQASYYRTSNGAEIDLILTKGIKKIALEIKSSTSPKVSKSFWNSIETIAPDRTVVIVPVEGEYPIADHVMVMPLHAFVNIV